MRKYKRIPTLSSSEANLIVIGYAGLFLAVVILLAQ
jgi:hypothetical protein